MGTYATQKLKSNSKVLVTVQVYKSEREAWKKLAHDRHVSLSELIRELMNEAGVQGGMLEGSTPPTPDGPTDSSRTKSLPASSGANTVGPNDCDHLGYERFLYCYRCGEKTR
jgi:hypothetical protein